MGEDDELQTETPSLDDIVRSAWDKHTEPEKLAEKITSTEVEIPAEETETQRSERQRNERGQFVAKEQVEQTTAPKPTTDAGLPTEQPEQHSRAAVEPPRGWSADEKALWASLPPAIHAAVSRRETEVSNGFRQLSDEKRQYEQAFQPVQALSQQYQLPGAEVINRLVSAEQKLQKDPVAAISELAQAYGVDLAALVNGTQQPARPAPQFDPNVIPGIIDKKLQEWQENQALTGQIQSFANERDDKGLKHPHFEAARPLMKQLLLGGNATDLQDAYDKATWAMPDIRSQLLATQTQAPNRQVARSRSAAVSIKGAPGNGKVTNANGTGKSIDEIVRDAYAEHAGGSA